jgi:CRP-like cAMP-binding protein
LADNVHSLTLMLRKLEAYCPLDDEDRSAILDLPFVQRRLEAGSYFLREGERPMQCAVLVSGYAYRHKLSGDGHRQIVSLHIPGEALDFQNLYLDVADHNLQTLTGATLAMIPQEAIRGVFNERPAVGRAIMKSVLAEASISREWILNVGRRDARSRIGHLLCEFAVRMDAQGLNGPDGYHLPMTQEQIGDAVGLTSVHVNRTLKGLEADGLLFRNKRQISFPDWERLRDAGDFTKRYLHLGEQVKLPPNVGFGG